MVVAMATIRGLDPFPRSDLVGFPAPVRVAVRRRGRAVAALRVYKRRGWNTVGVQAECDRAALALKAALDQMAFDEQNPGLF